MKTVKLLLPLVLSGLLAAATARADTFSTAVGGGVGAVAGAVVGDSMGGRRGAIIGSGIGGAMGAIVGQSVSSPPPVYYSPAPVYGSVYSAGYYAPVPVYERRVDYYYQSHDHHHGHGWGHYKHHHEHHDGYRH